jgi:hypothetical protein
MQTSTHVDPMAAALLAQLEHVTYLLNSCRLIINDPIARQIAAKAVEEAQAVVKQAKEAK